MAVYINTVNHAVTVYFVGEEVGDVFVGGTVYWNAQRLTCANAHISARFLADHNGNVIRPQRQIKRGW